LWHNLRVKHCLLPYGSIGWTRKRALFEELVAACPGPPFRFDRVLVLVPSSRMTRTYRKLFLDAVEKAHGATALVPPVIQTLHGFLNSLSARVQGPALIDENTRLVLSRDRQEIWPDKCCSARVLICSHRRLGVAGSHDRPARPRKHRAQSPRCSGADGPG
jgi:hypothetical protein